MRKIEKIVFQVNKKKYVIILDNLSFIAFEYMRDIKRLKQRCRYAITHNEPGKTVKNGTLEGVTTETIDNVICSYSFISKRLDMINGNRTYYLVRDSDTFFVKGGILNYE